MAATLGRVSISAADVQAWANTPGGDIAQFLEGRGRRVQAAARALAPNRTGRLAGSITVEVRTRGGWPYAWIGTDVDYARYQHDGTGVYGPAGTPIVVGPGRVMHWTTPGGAEVFSRRSSGAPPTYFLRDALPAAA